MSARGVRGPYVHSCTEDYCSNYADANGLCYKHGGNGQHAVAAPGSLPTGCECDWGYHRGKPCTAAAADHGSVTTSPALCLQCLFVCEGERDDAADALADEQPLPPVIPPGSLFDQPQGISAPKTHYSGWQDLLNRHLSKDGQ